MAGRAGSRHGHGRSRGRALSTKDISPATVTSAKQNNQSLVAKEAAMVRFLYAARMQHLFKGSTSQCGQCWGWYDDPRHVGDSIGS